MQMGRDGRRQHIPAHPGSVVWAGCHDARTMDERIANASVEEARLRRAHGYEGSRPDILRHVPVQARRILEVGCSNGALGATIKARQEAHILGVEIDPVYAEVAATRLDRVVLADAATFAAQRPAEAPFDCVILADVLEHLIDPWMVFGTVTSWLTPGGVAIVSLPNALSYKALGRLLKERRWPRESQGVFDATHLRWFSLADAQALLVDAGLVVDEVDFRLWLDGRRREPVVRALTKTALAPFLGIQHIVVGHRPS